MPPLRWNLIRWRRRRGSASTVWLPVALKARLIDEASDYRPSETGGILLGYEADSTDLVICDLVDAGPDAERSRSRFTPDGEWQEREVAKLYAESGRLHTYLGDWHSHPAGMARPSRRDKETARRIAEHRVARAPRPLMLIIASEQNDWNLAAYRLEGKRMIRSHLRLCEPPT